MNLWNFFQILKGSQLRSPFKLYRIFMVVLVTSKNEVNPIKMKALEWPQGYLSIFIRSRADNSLVNGRSGRNSNSLKHLCMASLPANMKKIYSKMKALEWPQQISHCKCMKIFPHAKEQVTPQSIVGSGRNSNYVETLWLSSLPARIRKIQSNMKALAWPEGYISIFRCSRADTSVVNGVTWQKFELIQAFMHVLITCKNKEDSIKNEGARVAETCLPL